MPGPERTNPNAAETRVQPNETPQRFGTVQEHDGKPVFVTGFDERRQRNILHPATPESADRVFAMLESRMRSAAELGVEGGAKSQADFEAGNIRPGDVVVMPGGPQIYRGRSGAEPNAPVIMAPATRDAIRAHVGQRQAEALRAVGTIEASADTSARNHEARVRNNPIELTAVNRRITNLESFVAQDSTPEARAQKEATAAAQLEALRAQRADLMAEAMRLAGS